MTALVCTAIHTVQFPGELLMQICWELEARGVYRNVTHIPEWALAWVCVLLIE